MVRRIIALGAAGALVLMMLPSVASAADNPAGTASAVNLTVTGGTTIYAPTDVNIDTGKPGDSPTGAAQVQWMSNETTKDIQVAMTTSLTYDTTNVIDNDNVSFSVNAGSSYTVFADTTTYYKVSDIAGSTTLRENKDFLVKVYIPGVPAGAYVGGLTFRVATP